MVMYEINNAPISRLELFKTQHELALNFYDDHEFCPIHNFEEVTEHRQRIQRRISPQSSPITSPSRPSSTRAIPIIDPTSMAPVTVPSKPSSPPPLQPQPSLPANHWPALCNMSHPRVISAVVPPTGQTRHHPMFRDISV